MHKTVYHLNFVLLMHYHQITLIELRILLEYHFADSKSELPKKMISKIQNAGFKIKTKEHYNDMGFLIARK